MKKYKEALKNICAGCESKGKYTQTACPFRSISNDYCEDVENINKALKQLEQIKNIIYDCFERDRLVPYQAMQEIKKELEE